MNVGLEPTEVVSVPRTAVAIPPALARRTNRVLRPKDAAAVYAHPRPEMARLARTGVVRRIATGYYVLTPTRRIADPDWRPNLHAAALGIAQADYGVDDAALMGIGAARYFGAVPREIAVTVVAVPKQRPTLRTNFGRVVFVRRTLDKLDLERIDTELNHGWVTTVEQTLLDLAARPTLGDLPAQDVEQAIRALWLRADAGLLEEIAVDQRRLSTLARARRLVEEE